MISKVCRSASIVLALSAGAVLADDTVEHVFTPSADSYQHWANQPHGDAPFLELYELFNPHQEGVGMIAFDLSLLVGIAPENLISAELQLFPLYSGQTPLFDGDSGVLSLLERGSSFDEIEPNPAPDSIGDPLAELSLSVDDLSPIALNTAELLEVVRGWTVDPAGNYGLDVYFSAPTGAGATHLLAIHSSETDVAGFEPRLVVMEQVPLPGTSILLVAGALSSTRRRR